MPKVSIIILNYNGRAHTMKCLRALEKIAFTDRETILYDNGSTDGTSEVVRSTFKKVRVVTKMPNIGYARGTNDAYRFARGKYILLLNNDTIPTKDFLANLVDRLEKSPQNGIVQPKLIFVGSKKLQAGGTFFTPTGFLYYMGYGKDPRDPRYNSPTEVYTVNGACMLIRREVIDKIGLFDGDFFLYFEETDFCHRALLAGYKVWYEPSATVYHIGSADNRRYDYASLIYYATRNRVTSYIKNFGTMRLLTVLPLHLVLCVASAVAYASLGRIASSLAVFKALLYIALNLRIILRKRAKIQTRMRKWSDNDFLPRLTRNPRLEYYIRLMTGLERYQD